MLNPSKLAIGLEREGEEPIYRQLIRHIRELPDSIGEVPAVAVTAYASEVDRKRALDAGYQAHITKPFPAERLISTLAKLVEQRAQPSPQENVKRTGPPT